MKLLVDILAGKVITFVVQYIYVCLSFSVLLLADTKPQICVLVSEVEKTISSLEYRISRED